MAGGSNQGPMWQVRSNSPTKYFKGSGGDFFFYIDGYAKLRKQMERFFTGYYRK